MIQRYDIRITTISPVIAQVSPGLSEINEPLRIVPTALLGAIRQSFRFMFGENSPAEAKIFGSETSAGAIQIRDDFRFEGTPNLRSKVPIDRFTGAAAEGTIFELREIPAGTTIVGTIFVRDVSYRYTNVITDALMACLSHTELRLGRMTVPGFGAATCEVIDLDRTGEILISYTHEDEAHNSWVLGLAERLHKFGFQVIFDEYDLKYGDNLHFFMEDAVRRSDKVLVIMTPDYKTKASARKGGAGYEFSMILSQLLSNLADNSKVIPVLRKGTSEESVPLMLQPYLYCDVRDDSRYEPNLSELVSAVLGKPKRERPPGRR